MATDNFDRANGLLGSNWTAMPLDGSSGTGLAIASNQVKGTDVSQNSNGNFWNADSFGNNHFSEITVATSSLSANAWIAPAVRCKSDGSNLLVIYWNNAGTYTLQAFYKIGAGAFNLLGTAVTLAGPLSVGAKLRLTAVGNTFALTVDGVGKLGGYQTFITTGSGPGVAIAGNTAVFDDWAGGSVGNFAPVFWSTDGNNVEKWLQLSQSNASNAMHFTRILRPTSPAGGKAHNFLYVLPVSPENDFTYGDGTNYIRGLNAHNAYNVTLIEPSFDIDSWYGNHATNQDRQFETFMVNELKPWVTANLSTTGTEKHWGIGFSKSGFGPQSIWFRNPSLFHVGAFWDFPAQGFTIYNQFSGSSDANYGTDANFQTNYRMTDTFLDTYKAPFQSQNRLWISGYQSFQADVTNWDAKLTTKGILHTYGTPASIAHLWTSGWVPAALTALDINSIALSSVTAPIRENALNAQANGPNAIDLAWAPTGAASYIIERKSTP